MCCLFGMIDYGHNFSGKQKSRILATLARECEARGTDATGIAYIHAGKQRIYKRPLPARRMRFRIPNGISVIMGHTRLTTQGNAQKWQNNHPFPGNTPAGAFALAHNGVLYNDTWLRQSLKLPKTNIETDSYIAVQLIEKMEALDFTSLRFMAEEVEGSFCFTILDSEDNLYIVKGDNPLCLYHYPRLGLYIYASTEAILTKAIRRMGRQFGLPEKVTLEAGDILKIDRSGNQERGSFDSSVLYLRYYQPARSIYSFADSCCLPMHDEYEATYIDELKTVARYYGYEEQLVDAWLQDGFTTDDIEDFLYCGEM